MHMSIIFQVGINSVFQKGFPSRCGCISVHFKEPEMAPIIEDEHALPENF